MTGLASCFAPSVGVPVTFAYNVGLGPKMVDASGNPTNILSSSPNGVQVTYENDTLNRLNAFNDAKARLTSYAKSRATYGFVSWCHGIDGLACSQYRITGMYSCDTIVYCHCKHTQLTSPAVKAAVLRRLCESDQPFEAVPDLCELAARRDPSLRRLAGAGLIKIAACFPRAVQWIFAAGQAPLPSMTTQVVNLRTQTADQATTALLDPRLDPNLPSSKPAIPHGSNVNDGNSVLGLMRVVLHEGAGTAILGTNDRFAAMSSLLEHGFAVTRTGPASAIPVDDGGPMLVTARWQSEIPRGSSNRIRWSAFDKFSVVEQAEAARSSIGALTSGSWIPWFPVIDYDRCQNCMQCLSFCLFGVFGLAPDKRIQVQHPGECKTNCPACSRVCPSMAIMFPKYKAAPINGDEKAESGPNPEPTKIDFASLFEGDVYAKLRARGDPNPKRFSQERDPGKALAERQRRLALLANDIPLEVLKNLPSQGEIARRAREAAAKAKSALSGLKE